MAMTGPLFKWFGSKWLSAKTLPPPIHDTIIEPFAGGAGYSLRHVNSSVIICERDPHVFTLWQWLIQRAQEHDIRAIPIDIKEGTDIRTIGLSDGQALLLKTWQRTNNVGDCWTVSPWGNKPGQWTANTRARIASEFHQVKHWRVYKDGFECMTIMHHSPATWFIDPCYQYNYQYRGTPTDYTRLAAQVSRLNGQVIVCEAICQKTGAIPNWLPFREFGSRITSRRKTENNHQSKELIYTRP
jgi:site-specific DNA-adenine methylase